MKEIAHPPPPPAPLFKISQLRPTNLTYFLGYFLDYFKVVFNHLDTLIQPLFIHTFNPHISIWLFLSNVDGGGAGSVFPSPHICYFSRG